MMSCKDYSKHLAKGESHSFRQKIEAWLHTLICVRCRFFTEQIKSLGKQARSNFETFRKVHKSEIDQLKDKIKKNM